MCNINLARNLKLYGVKKSLISIPPPIISHTEIIFILLCFTLLSGNSVSSFLSSSSRLSMTLVSRLYLSCTPSHITKLSSCRTQMTFSLLPRALWNSFGWESHRVVNQLLAWGHLIVSFLSLRQIMLYVISLDMRCFIFLEADLQGRVPEEGLLGHRWMQVWFC